MNWQVEPGAPRAACRLETASPARLRTILAPFLLTTCFFYTAAVNMALADNWLAPIRDASLPSHFVAVDKARQTFHFFEKKSPLKLKYTYPCTTGQQAGDKQKLNDLRTPEGVYFVEYKIVSGLDFKEYGGIAYTLNYPNPVDRLRGKTGHGIWIHSKGFGIVPRDTRGCVAIGLDDINEVGPSLTPGTAVILAEELDEKPIPNQDDGTARQLRRLMAQWSTAWASRSRKMFEFYDPEAYTKAMPESFNAFRQNKERLFRSLKFIKIFNREIHVLEGPDYWVTWAEQFYTAPNLSTEGTRRLYWQKDNNSNFRIVGMEWIPRNMGMLADFQKGRLLVDAGNAASDASSELPVPPRLTMPELPAESAAQQSAPPQKADVPESGNLLAAAPLVPAPASSQPPAVILWGNREPTPIAPSAPGLDAPHPATSDTGAVSEINPPPAPNNVAANPADRGRNVTPTTEINQTVEYLSAVSADVGDMLENWRQAWEAGRLDDYIRYYDDRAVQQGRFGAKNIRRQKEVLWGRVQPTLVQFSGMRIAPDNESSKRLKNAASGEQCVVVDMNQIYADSSGHSDKGTKALQLCSAGQGWKIRRENWIALQPNSQREGDADLHHQTE